MCLYPQYGKNRKYVKNKKNGGVVPHLTDRRIEYIPYGCGNCMECRKQYARQWRVRLMEEVRTNKNGKFITLTFSDESIKELLCETVKITNKQTGVLEKHTIESLKGYVRDNQIAKLGVRRFLERWRKWHGKSLRHWLVTELGHNGTENIHIHGIIWVNDIIELEGVKIGWRKEVEKLWKYGYIWPRKDTETRRWVNNQTVNYIVKYISKIDKKHKEYKAVVLTSPGIGAGYINERAHEEHKLRGHKGENTIETYRSETGHKMTLPIYYRNKLYTEAEREQLWINKLDKEIRYVAGEKIDISKGDDLYKNILQFYRRKNIELGYGTRTNENRKQYEEDRRDIMYETRIKRTMQFAQGPPREYNNNKENASGGPAGGVKHLGA